MSVESKQRAAREDSSDDLTVRVAEAGANASGQVPLAGDERGMEERVHNRLLALGYEGVEIARGAWAAR